MLLLLRGTKSVMTAINTNAGAAVRLPPMAERERTGQAMKSAVILAGKSGMKCV